MLTAVELPKTLMQAYSSSHGDRDGAERRFCQFAVLRAVQSVESLRKSLVLRGSAALHILYELPRTAHDMDFIHYPSASNEVFEHRRVPLFNEFKRAVARQFIPYMEEARLAGMEFDSKADVDFAARKGDFVPVEFQLRDGTSAPLLAAPLEIIVTDKIVGLFDPARTVRTKQRDAVDLADIGTMYDGRLEKVEIVRYFNQRRIKDQFIPEHRHAYLLEFRQSFVTAAFQSNANDRGFAIEAWDKTIQLVNECGLLN